MKIINKKTAIALTTLFFIMILAGTVTAADPTTDTQQINTATTDPADIAITTEFRNSSQVITSADYKTYITARVNATNNGPDPANNIVITDTVPPELKSNGQWWVSYNNGKSWTYKDSSFNSATMTWTIPTLANSQTALLDIGMQVMKSDIYTTNTVNIISSSIPDPVPGNNEASATIFLNPAADLAITKTASNNSPNTLDTITFTLTAINNGPNTATNVKVSDLLPTGLTYVSDDGEGSYINGLWTIGTLNKNQQRILHIIATVNTITPATNTATITGDQYDWATSNNIASTTITPVVGIVTDIAVTKQFRFNGQPITEADNKQYIMGRVNATNLGPRAATNVVIVDTLPSDLRFIGQWWVSYNNGRSWTLRDASFNPATMTWTLPTLAVGQTALLDIVVQYMQSETTTNIATLTSCTPTDWNPLNNIGTATIGPST